MAVTINAYDEMISKGLSGNIDFDTDVHKIILLNDTHTFAQANDDLADITANQLATGNGYTQDDEALVSPTISQAAGVTSWDANDVTWTASGGSIGPARFAVIYNDTVTTPDADALLVDINFGVNETAGNGTDFKVNFNAGGIYTVT